MKGLVESINTINEASGKQWEVDKSLDNGMHPTILAKFTAPDKEIMWMEPDAGLIAFASLKELESNFADFDMEDEYRDVEKLKVGQSYSPDGGINIYIRIK